MCVNNLSESFQSLFMKKRTLRFSLLFLMMLIFAILEDMLAASVSGASMIIEVVPLIVVIAFPFTLLTELFEEHFEYGRQPLEKIIDEMFAHFKKNKIKPTYRNIKTHIRKNYPYNHVHRKM